LSEFTSFESFAELSFQDREDGFDFVSLMIFFLVKRLSDPSTIISGDSLPFSISNRNKRAGVERIPNEFMDLFGVVCFVHDIKVRGSGRMTLFEESFGVNAIMDRMLGDLQTGDNLLICID
jgi:hypothetical protein